MANKNIGDYTVTGNLITEGRNEPDLFNLPDWLAGEDYIANDIVIEGGSIYNCVTPHTSSVFASDAANWSIVGVGGATMTGATEDVAGVGGEVPAPADGRNHQVLRGDGTFGTAIQISNDIPDGSDGYKRVYEGDIVIDGSNVHFPGPYYKLARANADFETSGNLTSQKFLSQTGAIANLDPIGDRIRKYTANSWAWYKTGDMVYYALNDAFVNGGAVLGIIANDIAANDDNASFWEQVAAFNIHVLSYDYKFARGDNESTVGVSATPLDMGASGGSRFLHGSSLTFKMHATPSASSTLILPDVDMYENNENFYHSGHYNEGFFVEDTVNQISTFPVTLQLPAGSEWWDGTTTDKVLSTNSSRWTIRAIKRETFPSNKMTYSITKQTFGV